MALFAGLSVIDGTQPLCYIVNFLKCVSVLVVRVLIHQPVALVVEACRGVLSVRRIFADRLRTHQRPGTDYRALISAVWACILVAIKSKSVARKWIDTFAVDTWATIEAKSVYRGSNRVAGARDFVGLVSQSVRILTLTVHDSITDQKNGKCCQ